MVVGEEEDREGWSDDNKIRLLRKMIAEKKEEFIVLVPCWESGCRKYEGSSS